MGPLGGKFALGGPPGKMFGEVPKARAAGSKRAAGPPVGFLVVRWTYQNHITGVALQWLHNISGAAAVECVVFSYIDGGWVTASCGYLYCKRCKLLCEKCVHTARYYLHCAATTARPPY